MKNYWPLLIAALIAVGVFFAIGSQSGVTGLAGPAKYGQYGWENVRPTVAVPAPVYVPGQEVYVGSETLVKRDCVMAREIYHANTMQNFQISAALNELIAACNAKGY